MYSEFNLIEQYFTCKIRQNTDLSIGDDAALVRIQDGYQLAVSTDMLVAGTHFFADAAPYDIGWKSLAVNISDMAAISAQAKWATLTIAQTLEGLKNETGKQLVFGIFSSVSYCIDLLGTSENPTPYIETNEAVVKAFRPKSFVKSTS